MKATVINEGPERTYAVIFDQGDEFMASMLSFSKEHGLSGSSFTAIGAFSDVTLAYFERDRKAYRKNPFHEQVEVLSLVGDIAMEGDEPKIHAHVLVGRADSTTRGGHIMEAHVWPTLEVIVTESPRHLQREYDEESGLALIRV